LVDNVITFTDRGGRDARGGPGARGRHPARDRRAGRRKRDLAAQRSRFFQHFNEADSATARKHWGTWLAWPSAASCPELMQERIG